MHHPVAVSETLWRILAVIVPSHSKEGFLSSLLAFTTPHLLGTFQIDVTLDPSLGGCYSTSKHATPKSLFAKVDFAYVKCRLC